MESETEEEENVASLVVVRMVSFFSGRGRIYVIERRCVRSEGVMKFSM